MSLTYNKRQYSLSEFYRFIYEAIRTMPYLRKAKRKQLIDTVFVEKIMLAVTEVNGCQACSYFHTSQALKSGMSESEISSMLSGESTSVTEEESIAILFAQHYADSHGIPDVDAWQRLVNYYGRDKSLGILSVIRAIMVGNTHGIGFGSFKDRLKSNPVKGSHIIYEIAIMVSIIIFLPLGLVHALTASLLKKPLINFQTD